MFSQRGTDLRERVACALPPSWEIADSMRFDLMELGFASKFSPRLQNRRPVYKFPSPSINWTR